MFSESCSKNHADDRQDAERQRPLDEEKPAAHRASRLAPPSGGCDAAPVIHRPCPPISAIAMVAALWVLVLPAIAAGQQLLPLPHGLRWGDSPQKMIDWASRHSLDVSIRMPGDQPQLRIIRIEPKTGMIPETEIRTAEGRFLNGRLFEFTAHYDETELPYELMLARFEKFRRDLTHEHGEFRANRVLREIDGGFVIRTRSFHREPVKGLFLLLTLTTIEDPERGGNRARYSLVYRNENLMAELARQ